MRTRRLRPNGIMKRMTACALKILQVVPTKKSGGNVRRLVIVGLRRSTNGLRSGRDAHIVPATRCGRALTILLRPIRILHPNGIMRKTAACAQNSSQSARTCESGGNAGMGTAEARCCTAVKTVAAPFAPEMSSQQASMICRQSIRFWQRSGTP